MRGITIGALLEHQKLLISKIIFILTHRKDYSNFAENGHARHEFYCKHMKRNVPNLQLPEIQNETVWIDLTPHELNMLQWNSRSSSIKEQVMMCSHYQLSERETLNIGDFVPVEEAQKRMSIRKERN